MNKKEKEELQAKFKKWLSKHYKKKDGSDYAESTIDMIKSDAFFLENTANYFGIDLKRALSESKNPDLCLKILKDYRDKLEKHFTKENEKREKKGIPKRSNSPSADAEYYVKWLSFLLDFYNDKKLGWTFKYFMKN